MTIAIAAFGNGAGEAVRQGVLVAEILGRGSIGGFAVFSVLDEKGTHRQQCCQEGGIAAAVEGMLGLGSARCAAVISSGPFRPEPLSQFLSGQSGIGLVTGHRLPNRVGAGGRPVNVATLARIEAGHSPADAVGAELHGNPELDVGLLAVTWDGRIGFGNSRRVLRRSDLGLASRIESDRGFALLCNSIHAAPGVSIAGVVGNTVWGCLTGKEPPCFVAELADPVPLVPAPEDRIDLDGRNRVIRISTAEPRVGSGDVSPATVIYVRASVWRHGRQLGYCMSEVMARVADGRAVPDPACQHRFVVERASDDPA